jgi:hypothetical protein
MNNTEVEQKTALYTDLEEEQPSRPLLTRADMEAATSSFIERFFVKDNTKSTHEKMSPSYFFDSIVGTIEGIAADIAHEIIRNLLLNFSCHLEGAAIDGEIGWKDPATVGSIEFPLPDAETANEWLNYRG